MISWPFIQKQINESSVASFFMQASHDVNTFLKSDEMQDTIRLINNVVIGMAKKIENSIENENPQSSHSIEIEKPDLLPPDDNIFSIHNIEIGETKEVVEKTLGEPKRISLNEYGTEWHTYHEEYHNFVNVIYSQNDQVIGLYTNQDIISSTKGIKRGSTMESVRAQLGSPLDKIQKGFVFYQIDKDADYDIFLLDESYITIFYDKHKNNTVTSIQIIHEDLENAKEGFYTEGDVELKEGLEHQLFDLTNATRVNHQLPILTWDDHVRGTARKHSSDMAENHYFDHTNLEGETPFDRMKEDNLFFTAAGENLAYGQFSSIYAHEGLMNSLGHRKNILQTDFEYLGVGVAFNSEHHPYYTQNFYAK